MSKILLIQGKDLPELQSLKTELSSRGHRVDVWYPQDLTPVQFTDGTLADRLRQYDLIYYRTGFGDAGVAEFPELLGDRRNILVNQCLLSGSNCFNKLHQAFDAIRAGVLIPPTYHGRLTSFDVLETKLGLPFIAKIPNGIRGEGVYKVEDRAGYEKCLKVIPGEVLWQKFIKNDGDYRVFVIGGDTHAIYKRIPSNGNFKNNMAQGGRGEKVEDESLLIDLRRIAETMARQSKVEVAGVDIIRSLDDHQLYFTEINVNPGWRGLDDTLGTNTASAVADYFESRINSSST